MKKIVTLLLAVVLVMATAVPAFATSFTKSIENKGAPTVVDDPVIYKPDGEVDTTVSTGDLIVTPVKDKDDAEYDAIKERLEKAYTTLNKNSLNSLCPGLQEEIGSVSINDLVVRDLFDVTLVGDYHGQLVDGKYLKITFKVSDASSLVTALFSADGETWSTISGDNMVINSDGTVTITVYDEGVVAFLYDNGKLPDRKHNGSQDSEQDGPYAPQTSDPTWSIVCWVAAGGAVILAAVGIAEKRKSFKKYNA